LIKKAAYSSRTGSRRALLLIFAAWTTAELNLGDRAEERSRMAKVWTHIRETIEQHGSAALLSVVAAAGSVPRERGARIVLQPDGGFFGSIGGGRLEYEAIAAGVPRSLPDEAALNFAIGRSVPISASAAAA
jgi:hypothetical protein